MNVKIAIHLVLLAMGLARIIAHNVLLVSMKVMENVYLVIVIV